MKSMHILYYTIVLLRFIQYPIGINYYITQTPPGVQSIIQVDVTKIPL